MDTPICDFVARYAQSGAARLHMPGHKGIGPLGIEQLDITEISGADSLYEAAGIIAASEANASAVFGCPTFYSTEGASQCIRAMVYLCLLKAKTDGRRPLIAAGRNAHKVLLSAAALLDVDIHWLYGSEDASYLSCSITAAALEDALSNMAEKPVAVYLTSPDYLGNMADIAALAQVAHRHGVLLAVDNAHGAYLKFLPQSLHPMDLGADLCCSSAHKTLPVLTGGAYLHTSPALSAGAKNALALFGSTSPSYLILQSLDAANPILAGDFPARLAAAARSAGEMKARLRDFDFVGGEPMKLTLRTAACGYTGIDFAAIARDKGIECEFADPDHVVFMISPATDLSFLEAALTGIEKRAPLDTAPPRLYRPKKALSIREATLCPHVTLPLAQCEGRILAAATVGCPPAVPIAVCGELLDENVLERMSYYGITHCCVTLA